MCGLKRKFDELEWLEPGYVEQRQSVLHMSMSKLQLSPLKRGEPSLRRSVLISNTLKHIECELVQEGVKVPPGTSYNILPSIAEPSDRLTLDPLPVVETSNQKAADMPCVDSSSESVDSENLSRLVADADTVMETLTPKTQTDSNLLHQVSARDFVMDSILYNCDKLTISSFSSLFDLDSASPPALPSAQTREVKDKPLAECVADTTSMSLSTFTGLELFSDIDLSRYEFDLFTAMSSSSKLPPLSAEDLVHSFPPTGAFTDSFTSYSGATPHSPNISCKNDIINDDLDHIMQVLVGI